MVKKWIVILVAIVVSLVLILIFLFRTPKSILEINKQEPYGISILEGKHGPVFGEIVNRKCYITETEKKAELIKLISDANLKYIPGGLELVSYSGVAVTYSISFDYVEYFYDIDVFVADNVIYMSIDGKSVTIGLFDSGKYEGKKIQFVEQLLSIIEDDLEIME